ncbi:MAG: hypothetical protein NT169_15175 [Chloroflexi bacterium]|nr:hypothetical protein [Chloroflexota bacterium]
MGVVLEQMARVVQDLEGTTDWEIGLKRILENEIRRRLSRYALTDQQFQRKYGVEFETFRQTGTVRQLGYSYEVESDFCDWEMAISGLRSLKQRLAEVSA